MPAHHARLSPGELYGLKLPARREEGLAPGEMTRLIQELSRRRPAWDLLAPHVAFSADGYLRKRLYRDADWEMLLLCWLPGHKTVVHDHGGSVGAVVVLTGQLDECQYQLNEPGTPLGMAQYRCFTPSEVALEDVQTIHKNENRGEVPAISLHLYSPPLRVLNSYDPLTGVSHPVYVHEGPTVAVGGKPLRRPAAARKRALPTP
jgi:cysteine dioxygenase